MDSKTKVLVMDDEPLVRLMICSGLEQSGVLVCEAGSCTEAIELVRHTQFDVAVFDYRLPDGNGLDVVRSLREEGIETPVILLSGESEEIQQDAIQEIGICAVLTKPPDIDQLLIEVSKATGSKASVKITHVGRYAYWKVSASDEAVAEEWGNTEWLAADLSDLKNSKLNTNLIECIRKPRNGIIVVGADTELREQLQASGTLIDFVENMDELTALSRRSSTPQERASLLDSIVQRQ